MQVDWRATGYLCLKRKCPSVVKQGRPEVWWPAPNSARQSSIQRVTVKTAVVGNTHMLKAVLSCCLHRSTVSRDLRVLHLVGVRQDI